MSNLEPVITIQLGNHPLPIYRLSDGHPGVANEIELSPPILSVNEGILQWLEMAQQENKSAIKVLKETLQDALDYSQEYWRSLKAQDILERALVNDKGAIGELQSYLVEAIYKKIDEYDWLKALEELQKDIKEKDARIAELVRERKEHQNQFVCLEHPLQ